MPKSTPSLIYSPLSFFQKFLEMNRVMWWTHHDLSSPIHGEDQHGQSKTDESRPWTWPFMKRGLNYYSSKETNHYIHLMGNPLLWWAASSAVILYIASCISGAYTFIKVKSSPTKVERDRFGKASVIGCICHSFSWLRLTVLLVFSCSKGSLRFIRWLREPSLPDGLSTMRHFTS